jgi:hypothetical protein
MAREEKVTWKNGSLIGEGLWSDAGGDAGVVVCHPHPQMGGSLYNNVVETVCGVFSAAGFSTLRFNFRGVGGSTGCYDEGAGEKEDVLSACDFIKSRGVKKLTLAGYSFGAWICCRLLNAQASPADDVLLISPPQKYFDFRWNGLENTVKAIICGDSDSFCDAADLGKKAAAIGAELFILQKTDHFYAGREPLLARYLEQYIAKKKLAFNKNGVMVDANVNG